MECEIGVSGQAGNIRGTIDKRGNIFEGPRARAYPMPPLRGTGFTDMMATAARSARLASVPRSGGDQLAAATRTAPACMYHGFCNRGGCHVRRQEFDRRHDHPEGAGARSRLKVVTDAHVTTIDVNGQGRITGVNYLNDGTEYFQPADVVLLASYTYENVRMLLLSKSKAFPNGLSNNHGQVGPPLLQPQPGRAASPRCFRANLTAGTACRRRASPSTTGRTTTSTTRGLDFIGGGNLWVYSDRRPIGAAGMNTFGRAPRWGSAWKAFIKENADRWNTAYLQKTTLPYEDNYLDLDPVVKDPLGFPVCRITADYKDNERKIAAFIQDKMEQWYRGGRRDRHPSARRMRHDGPVHARLRRHAHGRQPRDQRRESLGLLARGAEPRRARRVGDGHERRPEPDAHRAGAGLAHGGAPGEELEDRRRGRSKTGYWKPVAG